MKRKKYYIGIDGGGTHTKAVAVTRDGTVVCRAEGDTINFNSIGFDKAKENLEAILETMTQSIPEDEIDGLFIGCSALDFEADTAVTKAILGKFQFIDAKMNSDLFIALYGYSLNADGVLVISGTGSMGIARDYEGNIYTCGGWGYGVGDEGSAYDIAVRGINAAVRYYDGIGPHTKLYEALLEHYHLQCPKELIQEIYQPELNRKKIAGFAVTVTACAEVGDAIAKKILCEAAYSLAEIADSLIRKTGIRTGVGIYGGVFEHAGMVKERFVDIMHQKYPGLPIEYPYLLPEIGAAIMAMQEKGIEITEEIRKKLNTYCT